MADFFIFLHLPLRMCDVVFDRSKFAFTKATQFIITENVGEFLRVIF